MIIVDLLADPRVRALVEAARHMQESDTLPTLALAQALVPFEVSRVG